MSLTLGRGIFSPENKSLYKMSEAVFLTLNDFINVQFGSIICPTLLHYQKIIEKNEQHIDFHTDKFFQTA